MDAVKKQISEGRTGVGVPIWNREKVREGAMWMSEDPLQAKGTVFQTDRNSTRDQDCTAFWVCLRMSSDAMVARVE